jgi:hypothetical protein
VLAEFAYVTDGAGALKKQKAEGRRQKEILFLVWFLLFIFDMSRA